MASDLTHSYQNTMHCLNASPLQWLVKNMLTHPHSSRSVVSSQARACETRPPRSLGTGFRRSSVEFCIGVSIWAQRAELVCREERLEITHNPVLSNFSPLYIHRQSEAFSHLNPRYGSRTSDPPPTA